MTFPPPGEIVEIVPKVRARVVARGLVFTGKHARRVVGAPDLHTIQNRAAQREYPVHIQEVGGFAGDLQCKYSAQDFGQHRGDSQSTSSLRM